MSDRTPTQRRGLIVLIGALMSLASTPRLRARHGAVFALTVGSLLGVAAPAMADPSTPYFRDVPATVTSGSKDLTTVSFGWYQSSWDSGSTDRKYVVTIGIGGNYYDSKTVTAQPQVSGLYQTASFQLVNGATFTISIQAKETVMAPLVQTRTSGIRIQTFKFVNTGPQAPVLTVNGQTGTFVYTNRQTVNVGVRSKYNDDAPYVELDPTGQAAFACNCTSAMAYASGYWSGTFSQEIPTGDGIHAVSARLRDSARTPKTSDGFDGPVTGNAGDKASQWVWLDTTAPTVAIANAKPVGTAGQPVAFDASKSSDSASGVDPNAFVWTWGDNSPDTTGTAKVSHLYPGPGTYNGRVVVHDKSGHPGTGNTTNFASTTFAVTINPAAGGDSPTTVETTPVATTPPPSDPVAVTPTATDTPAPQPNLTPQKTKADIDLTPVAGGSVLPLIKSATGPIAQVELTKKAQVGKPIKLDLDFRDAAEKVTGKLKNSKGKVVDDAKAKPSKDGSSATIAFDAQKKSSTYTAEIKSGSQKLKLPFQVESKQKSSSAQKPASGPTKGSGH